VLTSKKNKRRTYESELGVCLTKQLQKIKFLFDSRSIRVICQLPLPYAQTNFIIVHSFVQTEEVHTLSEMPRNFELVTQQDANIELFRVMIIAELDAIKLYDRIVLLCGKSTSKDYSSLVFTKTQAHWFQMEYSPTQVM